MARNKGGLRFQPSGGARGPAVPVGKKQRLRIERLAHDGRGIAHEAGMTWFVSGGLPGEELEARVLGARSKVVEARSERLFGSSELRRREPCSVAGRCGGCTLQHLGHAEQLALKQRTLQEQLQRFAGMEPEEWAPPLVGPEFGYRRRARIAVRWEPKSRRLEVGFRASSSQEIVAFDECLVLVPALQTIAQALPALLRGFCKPEAIGHVELFHGTASALLLRHTVALAVEDRRRLEDFCAEHQAQLWLQGADEPRPVEPAAELGYALDDWKLTLAYRPGDFVQVNAPVNRLMVRQALEWLAPGAEERVLDLFCGLGNFSLPLARQVAQVVGVEGVAAMVGRASANALANGLDNAHFFQADLSKALAEAPWAAQGFTAVLLDPPRDGALEAVRGMSSLGARRVVYVSCNPATLARDAGEMARQGYRLKRAGILDMFPQTAHVEAMALFEAG
ncbi:TPA: 23S rRNA (uracil(1939)-C(5))-methyltransferase RlmD [Pseudomonas aeruginosa]|uniref:23S rRNA (uracil(1939)-C(5))-methyltransferase RlmD n=1 Tax=Pseudomonas aeruginosa TaxID=287 RepID=A0ABD7K0E1_PSEAI|nr:MULTISPECIES: 23S rRNA (uracil(1939)-C(5))-methyltransferase RlmD [Pseudomonas aeruginosa group]KFF34111.1 23S rRNA methyltransferase [Pseudomonas aeruginosa VRFPA01]KSC53168.1 23S rRNA (uracil(1939)-C(5))-methyltransferase [Pseudomonas paraeruginosa]KSL20649.1 23S rRNA (uracil(1939)-C(5))-methyltransferase [Pseudomonas aeruginosa]MBH8713424.1 23S rRNA (uracil(1939)-C(5))-methyltransferase RlmD [Pseudomonas aeruginosa]MBI8113893.1 23S rRNA (uracil(1939)-C(5))-methyltransferase RlmD [Pseudom